MYNTVDNTPENKLVPSCKYRSLAALNRYKNLCLWLPITKVGPTLPWGYVTDPTNSKVAIADEKAIPVFLKAKEYLKNHSYEVVSQWLATCGFPLSKDGVVKLFKERPTWDEISLPLEQRMKL